MKTMTYKSNSNQEQSRVVSYLPCPDPRCTHYLDENVALLLQATEEKKHNQIREISQDMSLGHTLGQLKNTTTNNTQAAFDLILHG